ncbi:MAG: Crp/Fnr family transcriptional regulator [Candidatus Eremiobacteraeota bacterium]|nr:Crp/Fnr family transcriptional regulator [Candidatus Eremiobacteraeota bacterium]
MSDVDTVRNRLNIGEGLSVLGKDRKTRGGVKASPITAELLGQNALLWDLSAADTARLIAHGEMVEMPPRYLIYQAEEEIRDVFFPIDCVLSIVTRMQDGSEIEVGTIGREGTSAIPLLMGSSTTANDCYCQVPGRAIKIPIADLHHLQKSDHRYRALFDRYLQAYVNFLGQLTACNRLHSIYERCARWLLLSQDRVQHDDIRLTHEYLAMMLGSRRSGVAMALAELQRAGFIHYVKGCITIDDRAGLENTTCECYLVAQKQFSDLLRPALRDADIVHSPGA